MKKGGADRATVLGLVLLLIVLFIIYLNLSNILFLMEGWSVGGTCGFSAAVAGMKVDNACLFDVESPTSLSCPRKNIQVSQESLNISFNGKRTTFEMEELSAKNIEKLFADELIHCWEKFGSGQVALFPEEKGSPLEGDDRTSCHICAEIYFEKEKVNSNEFASTNVYEYLNNEIYKDDEKYVQFLNNDKAHCQEPFRNGDGCWTEFEATFSGNKQTSRSTYHTVEGEEYEFNYEKKFSRITSINPDTTYAVVMMRRGYQVCEQSEDEIGKELTTFAYIIPQEELNSVCGMIIS